MKYTEIENRDDSSSLFYKPEQFRSPSSYNSYLRKIHHKANCGLTIFTEIQKERGLSYYNKDYIPNVPIIAVTKEIIPSFKNAPCFNAPAAIIKKRSYYLFEPLYKNKKCVLIGVNRIIPNKSKFINYIVIEPEQNEEEQKQTIAAQRYIRYNELLIEESIADINKSLKRRKVDIVTEWQYQKIQRIRKSVENMVEARKIVGDDYSFDEELFLNLTNWLEKYKDKILIVE